MLVKPLDTVAILIRIIGNLSFSAYRKQAARAPGVAHLIGILDASMCARKEEDEVSTSQEEPEVTSELAPTSTTELARSRRRTARGITSAEHVANELREAIHRGSLDKGDQINQQEWADRLGVSRAALREGLEAVATQSLLTHDPNRGYFVSTLTTPQAAQLYWLRICIEREVMLTVRRPSEAESADLKAACRTAIDAWNSED